MSNAVDRMASRLNEYRALEYVVGLYRDEPERLAAHCYVYLLGAGKLGHVDRAQWDWSNTRRQLVMCMARSEG